MQVIPILYEDALNIYETFIKRNAKRLPYKTRRLALLVCPQDTDTKNAKSDRVSIKCFYYRQLVLGGTVKNCG